MTLTHEQLTLGLTPMPSRMMCCGWTLSTQMARGASVTMGTFSVISLSVSVLVSKPVPCYCNEPR